MPIKEPRPPESAPPVVCSISILLNIRCDMMTYTTTTHLGLEHELDHHHTGTVDGILLATGRGTAGFVEQLDRSASALSVLEEAAYLGGFRHGHTDDLDNQLISMFCDRSNADHIHHSACYHRLAGQACRFLK